MKELKNRIKGLSAILLAVSLALCLVVRVSEMQVTADGTVVIYFYEYKDNELLVNRGRSYNYQECINNTRFSNNSKDVPGWSAGSGGSFVIDTSNSSSDILSYIVLDGERETTNYTGADSITYYTSATVSSVLPEGSYVMITGCQEYGSYIANDGTTIKSLTLVVYHSSESVQTGTPTRLTTGTKYSFPSTGSIHKIQGDPTNYYTTDFYVSQSGDYTILQ